MYETTEKDLRMISDMLFAIGTANVDYIDFLIRLGLAPNWYKTINDAAEAISTFRRLLSENVSVTEIVRRTEEPYIERIRELESDRSELTNEVARLKEQVYALTPNEKIMEFMTNVINEQATESDRLEKRNANEPIK